MHLPAVQWLLMSATLVLQVAALTLMVRRGIRATFPFFFNFLAFSLCVVALQIGMLSRPSWYSSVAYSFLFWGSTAIGTLLSFAVIYEVFAHILKPYSALVDLGKLLFRWAILFLALASVLTALVTTGPQTTKICAVIQVLDRSCGLMLCGLLLLFVLIESRLAVSWRAPAICIVAGLGANAAVSLAASFLRSRYPGWGGVLNLAEASSCFVLYACWVASFALPQPARRTAQDSPTRLILQRWNEAVMASPLIGRRSEAVAFSPIESFLPGVERTVERVMAQKMH